MLEDHERETILSLIKVLSILSTITSFFVVITYLLFPEKRKSCTSILIFVEAFAAMAFDGILIISGWWGDELKGPSEDETTVLCKIQGGGLLFFGNLVQFTWFFVSLNLFLRVRLDREEIPISLAIGFITGISFITTLIPLIKDDIKFVEVWCFLDNNNYVMLYSCFYGLMICLSSMGTILWVMIFSKLISSLRKEKQKSRSSTSEPINTIPLKYAETTNVEYSQKRALVFRQMIYVGGFLLLFYIMLTNRLIMTFHGSTYPGWFVHAFAVGIIGIYVFLVFGLTERNFHLWKDLLYCSSFRRISSQRSTTTTSTRYSSITN